MLNAGNEQLAMLIDDSLYNINALKPNGPFMMKELLNCWEEILTQLLTIEKIVSNGSENNVERIKITLFSFCHQFLIQHLRGLRGDYVVDYGVAKLFNFNPMPKLFTILFANLISIL